MSVPRLTILELMIGLCILGLVFSVPLQCRRVLAADDCRMAAEFHSICAAELLIMANHPAAWMDEFRPELRRISFWEEQQGLRLAQCSTYVQIRERRIADTYRATHHEDEFWIRFNAIAAQNAYRWPRVGPRGRPSVGLTAALYNCWPTVSVLCLMCLILKRIHRWGQIRLTVLTSKEKRTEFRV